MHACILKKNSQKPAIDFKMVKQALDGCNNFKSVVALQHIIIIVRIGCKLFLFYLACVVCLLVYFLIRQKFMDFLSCFVLARKIFISTIIVPKDF